MRKIPSNPTSFRIQPVSRLGGARWKHHDHATQGRQPLGPIPYLDSTGSIHPSSGNDADSAGMQSGHSERLRREEQTKPRGQTKRRWMMACFQSHWKLLGKWLQSSKSSRFWSTIMSWKQRRNQWSRSYQNQGLLEPPEQSSKLFSTRKKNLEGRSAGMFKSFAQRSFQLSWRGV